MLVNRKKLIGQLEAVSPGLTAKEGLQQSNCFAFRKGRVITFNDEVACSAKTILDVEGAVPADSLLALLRKLDDKEVDVSAGEGELNVNGSKREKSGLRMDPKVLMPLEGIEDPGKWKDLPKGFLEAVGIVEGCASGDKSNFLLTCIHLHPEWVEATDKFQIIRYPIKTGLSGSVVVRQASLRSVLGMDVKQFSETENWMHFRTEKDLMVSIRRHLLTYPDLGKFLAKKHGVKIKLPKELEGSLVKACIFGETGRTTTSYVTVELRPGKLKLMGRGEDGWYSKIEDVGYDGEGMKFAIAPKLLMDIVKRGGQVEMVDRTLRVDGDGKYVFMTSTGTVDE